MRKEKDFLGEVQIPEEALYGVHSVRAQENFTGQEKFSLDWYKATGIVKLACYKTVILFIEALQEKEPAMIDELKLPTLKQLNALIHAAEEVSRGEHYEYFIVPAIQGGAGTSINLNINEIIARRAMNMLAENGSLEKIDPIEAANIYQSTNDVIPSSLSLAIMRKLQELEKAVNTSRSKLEQLEEKHRNDLRISYTQLQEAVPGTFGQLFSAYNDALSRDWWRISKASERLKQVNLGGGATGSGISLPRFYIMEVVKQLRLISELPLAQAENLFDATSNQDSYVEAHAILKAHAVNLEKIADDLRLLASDAGCGDISLADRQTGSSIMPGKVNPVISEYIISSAHVIYANDSLITSLAARGNLELNAYLPLLGHKFLESMELLLQMNKALSEKLLKDMIIHTSRASQRLYHSPSVTTILSVFIGYHKAAELAKTMKLNKCSIFEANEELGSIPEDLLKKIMSREYLLKKGFTLGDLKEIKDQL